MCLPIEELYKCYLCKYEFIYDDINTCIYCGVNYCYSCLKKIPSEYFMYTDNNSNISQSKKELLQHKLYKLHQIYNTDINDYIKNNKTFKDVNKSKTSILVACLKCLDYKKYRL